MLVLLRCDDVSPTAPVRPTGFCVAINFIISLSLSPKTDQVRQARVVCVKFSKKVGRQVLENGEAYSQTPEARLRQPEPVGLSSGAGAKPEQPVCE